MFSFYRDPLMYRGVVTLCQVLPASRSTGHLRNSRSRWHQPRVTSTSVFSIRSMIQVNFHSSLKIKAGRNSENFFSVEGGNGKFSFVSFSAHPTFISEVRSILRRIDSLLDALAERRAIPGSSYHLRCEEIFKLHYLGDSIQSSIEGQQIIV